MRTGGANTNAQDPAKRVGLGQMKHIEKLYIAAVSAAAVVVLLIGLGLLLTLPVQARMFMVEQALVAITALAAGGLLLRSCAVKLRLARVRVSIERDPSRFIEAHGYAKSLRAESEFESLTARMSVLSGLYSIVSGSFGEALSSYLKLYRAYEPNLEQWRASVRSLDQRVQNRFAGKLSGDEQAVWPPANEVHSEEHRRAEESATGDESRAEVTESYIADE